MALEEILADVKQEGDLDPFAALEKDTPSESQTENEPKEDEPEVGDSTPAANAEDNVPFHKHPRWIQREQELEALRLRDEARERELAELRAQATREPVETEVPDWFSELYGHNTAAWEKYNAHQQAERERLKQEAVIEVERRQQAEVAENERWNGWVETEVERLAAAGKQFDRNELLKVMLDYRPTDPNNNLDFDAGYRIYEALKSKPDPARAQARKRVADTTSSPNVGERKQKDYMTSSELRNLKWGSIT